MTRLIVMTLLLASCSTQPSALKERVVERSVPVAVLPVAPAQVPAPPAPLGPRPKNDAAASDLLLAKVCEFVAYAMKTDSLLRTASGMGQMPLASYPECETSK